MHYRRNSRGLVAMNSTNWRARTHPIREKLWARLDVNYDLYDDNCAREAARFVAGFDDISMLRSPRAFYQKIFLLLDRFLALERPRARPEERDIAERLCRDVVNRILTLLPQHDASDLFEYVGRLDRWSKTANFLRQSAFQ